MSDWVQWSEIIRNIGLVVGGFIGLLIATWRGWAASHQARASQDQAVKGQRAYVTELFNAAVEQLGHERLEIRLGAILTLKRMSVDFRTFPIRFSNCCRLTSESAPGMLKESSRQLIFVR
jgi:hypothetical protein